MEEGIKKHWFFGGAADRKSYWIGFKNGAGTAFLAGAFAFSLCVKFYFIPLVQKTEAIGTQAFDLAIKGERECQAKFAEFTVLYEPMQEQRPLSSLQIMHFGPLGVNLTLGPQQGQQGQGTLMPAWFLPVKIEPRSRVPGAEYQWLSVKDGQAQWEGMMVALPIGTPYQQPSPQ